MSRWSSPTGVPPGASRGTRSEPSGGRFELGADHVEIDVRKTRDGVLVAAHGPVRGRFQVVRDRTPEVPTLAEVLGECVGKIGVVVDIERSV